MNLFNIFETYWSNDKTNLEKKYFEFITETNLKSKGKYISDWQLSETLTFMHFQKDSNSKQIIQNLLWFFDGQISGNDVLNRLGLKLPD